MAAKSISYRSFKTTDTKSEFHEEISGPEYDECLDASTLSQVHWKRSLDKGCLSKAFNEKPNLYSRVRELTKNTNLPLGSVLSPPKVPGPEDASSPAHPCDARPTSTCVLEDVSAPPLSADEAVPIHFTDEEFFHFLYSNKWGGSKMLRLVSGNFLQRLLTSLYKLEVNGTISARSTRAYLNNGFWKALPKADEAQDELAYVLPPSPTQETIEWVSETLLVNMVYYSIVTKTTPDMGRNILPAEETTSRTVFRVKSEVAKLPIKAPLSYALYSIGNLKLPSFERQTPLSKIHRLQNEIHALKEIKEKEKAEKPAPLASMMVKGGGAKKEEDEKPMSMSSDTNLIVENPHLFYDNNCVGKAVTEPNIPMDKTDKPSKEEVAMLKGNSVVNDAVLVSMSNREVPSKENVEKEMADSVENEKTVDEQRVKEVADIRYTKLEIGTDESDVCSSLYSEQSSLKEKDTVKKRLNLSGNEMYVSGLYKERDVNAKPISLRLQQANKDRQKLRNVIVKNVYDKFYQSRSMDVNSRFKRLATAKTLEMWKATGPQLPPKKNEISKPGVNVNPSESHWSKYYKDLEDMEMNTAVDRSTENAALNRILKQETSEVAEDTNTKELKKGKHKGKNNSNTTGDVSSNSNITLDLELRQKGKRQKHGKASNQSRFSRQQPLTTIKWRDRVWKTTSPAKKVTFENGLKSFEKDKGTKAMSDTNNKLPHLVNKGKEQAQTTLSDLEKMIENRAKLQRRTAFWKYLLDESYNRIPDLEQRPSRFLNWNENSTVPSPLGKKSNKSIMQSLLLERKSTKSVAQSPLLSNLQLDNVSKDAESARLTTTSDDSYVPRLTDSEQLRQDLARFDAGCKCDECCSEDNECLEELRPQCLEFPYTYPHKLGCLKKPSGYVKNPGKDHGAASSVKADFPCNNQVISDESLGEEIVSLLLLHETIVRKEILVSSLGKTFTTIVFIKN